jgi:hypothetical protein
MSKVVIFVFLAVLLGLPWAPTASAQQVVLSDGGTIDCLSFKMVGGNVRVLVNRDVVIDLAPGEVDMKRTFQQRTVKKALKPAAKRARRTQPKVAEAATIAPQASAAPEAATKKPLPPLEAQPAAPAAQAPPSAPVNPGTQAPKAAPVKPGSQVSGSQPSQVLQPAKPTAQPPATPAEEAQRRQMEKMGKQMEKAVVDGVPRAVALMPQLVLKGIWLFFIASPLGQFILLMAVITILIFWKVFDKAGEPGWQGIIPVFNLFILMKIAGKPMWWAVLLFVPLVGIVIAIFYNMALAERFGKSQLFGLGLCFIPTVFFGMLAFGDAQYQPGGAALVQVPDPEF